MKALEGEVCQKLSTVHINILRSSAQPKLETNSETQHDLCTQDIPEKIWIYTGIKRNHEENMLVMLILLLLTIT